ncbi:MULTISPECIES: alpha/beta hydrolase [Marinimicrobium]|uniref:alpha/beta hydrolase n=1 Tax=Marinimicrobium TaxID=359337 RepID=UPI0003F7E99F|nr:alpha/beta hydrolase-fold protein [Marinimicrobium agarilyticum]
MSLQQIEQSDPKYTQDGLSLLTVHSSALKGRGNIACYNAFSDARDIPIVILLHGVYGNHWVWMNLGGVDRVYDRLRASADIGEMLLVMPEDGSYYAGSGYLPLSHGPNAERWIVEDCLEAVLRSIPCVSERSNVYISGLSMGGYGALRLGAKYPGRFKGISAHSAITRLDEMALFVDEDLSLYQCGHPKEADLRYWTQENLHQLPPIRLDCGEDDDLRGGNVEYSRLLDQLGKSHDFQLLPGGHEWPYWHRAVERTFRFLSDLEYI